MNWMVTRVKEKKEKTAAEGRITGVKDRKEVNPWGLFPGIWHSNSLTYTRVAFRATLRMSNLM
jgi:hypothetical protein